MNPSPATLRIASANTPLEVPFARKDEAKALGARWDPALRKWYVPSGLALGAFAEWLPAGTGASLAPARPPPVAAARPASGLAMPALPNAVPLSRLLAGLSAVIARAFADGVWTTAEIAQVTLRDGHVYMDLVEQDAGGTQVAKARAIIWAKTARGILPAFQQSTGAELAAGMKVLVRAKPTYAARFGLSLEIDAIDSTYTLGELEARKREIRARLQREGVFDANRALPAPWDYRTVLVIAPQGAAGLGDFQAESQRLERAGVCRFVIATSRFQGEGAATEVRAALERALGAWRGPERPDAVVIIRGGGAANDLAWLNDYALARFVCDCPVPVLTGIGHQKDSTVLDEVAHRAFDTPSKVIQGIEEVIRTRARDARGFFEAIAKQARLGFERVAAAVERERAQVVSGAWASLQQARANATDSMHAVHTLSARGVRQARDGVIDEMHTVRTAGLGSVAALREALPILVADVQSQARSHLVRAASRSERDLQTVLDTARGDARRVRADVDRQLEDVARLSRQSARQAGDAAQGLFREISGQGPERTLRRGFALATGPDGRTLTRATDVRAGDAVELTLHDGVLRTRVEAVMPRDPPGPSRKK